MGRANLETFLRGACPSIAQKYHAEFLHYPLPEVKADLLEALLLAILELSNHQFSKKNSHMNCSIGYNFEEIVPHGDLTSLLSGVYGISKETTLGFLHFFGSEDESSIQNWFNKLSLNYERLSVEITSAESKASLLEAAVLQAVKNAKKIGDSPIKAIVENSSNENHSVVVHFGHKDNYNGAVGLTYFPPDIYLLSGLESINPVAHYLNRKHHITYSTAKEFSNLFKKLDEVTGWIGCIIKDFKQEYHTFVKKSPPDPYVTEILQRAVVHSYTQKELLTKLPQDFYRDILAAGMRTTLIQEKTKILERYARKFADELFTTENEILELISCVEACRKTLTERYLVEFKAELPEPFVAEVHNWEASRLLVGALTPRKDVSAEVYNEFIKPMGNWGAYMDIVPVTKSHGARIGRARTLAFLYRNTTPEQAYQDINTRVDALLETIFNLTLPPDNACLIHADPLKNEVKRYIIESLVSVHHHPIENKAVIAVGAMFGKILEEMYRPIGNIKDFRGNFFSELDAVMNTEMENHGDNKQKTQGGHLAIFYSEMKKLLVDSFAIQMDTLREKCKQSGVNRVPFDSMYDIFANQYSILIPTSSKKRNTHYISPLYLNETFREDHFPPEKFNAVISMLYGPKK